MKSSKHSLNILSGITVFVSLVIIHTQSSAEFLQLDVDKSLPEIIEALCMIAGGIILHNQIFQILQSQYIKRVGYFLFYIAADNFLSIHEKVGIQLNSSNFVQELSAEYHIWNQAISELLYFAVLGFFVLIFLLIPLTKESREVKIISISIFVGIGIIFTGGVIIDFIHELPGIIVPHVALVEDGTELLGHIITFQIILHQYLRIRASIQ